MQLIDSKSRIGKIIGLVDHDPGEFTHPALSQLRAYWEALRGRDSLPSRNDIDPRGIERALEFAFIAERIAPGIARIRLGGMHLNNLLGMEARGMPLTSFITPEMRDQFQNQTERAFSTPAAVEILLKAPRSMGRPGLKAKMILLPLRGENGQVARVLGGLVAEGSIGRAPRRFSILSANAQSCETTQQVQAMPSHPKGGAETTQKHSNADQKSLKPLIKRGHLALVHSAG